MKKINGLIKKYLGEAPKIADDCFVADGAVVIGKVTLKNRSSVWYNTVLRGDVGSITIGEYSNIQDNSIIHMLEEGETVIGDYVTVGHGVNIHNAEIGDLALIGNDAIILDNAKIGEGTIVGAGTVIPPRKVIPPRVLVLGNPYRIIKELTDEEVEATKQNALLYWELSKNHE